MRTLIRRGSSRSGEREVGEVGVVEEARFNDSASWHVAPCMKCALKDYHTRMSESNEGALDF